MAVPSLSAATGYAAGAPADGPTVRSDLEGIVNELTANLDATNFSDEAITTAKIADANVTNAKLASNSVYEDNVYFGETGSGLRCPRVANYSQEGSVNSAPGIAVVSKEVIWGGGTSDSVTFTYASDCTDGGTTFTATPHLLGVPVVASVEAAADVITGYNVTASDSSAITFTFTHLSSSATVQIEFGVMGAIS